MNKQDFNQLGGYPLETDTLDWMQEAYSLFNALGDVIGNYAIISGCQKVGETISDGVVFLDGELYPFKGGNIQTHVRILNDGTSKVFENGEEKPVHQEYWVTFASGADSILWANFKRPSTLLNLSSRILPAGTNPQLYSGDVGAIPTGWQLCDGTNSTPDLRSRFIVGYDNRDPNYSLIGLTGGEKETNLTIGQLPKHRPTGTTDTKGAHTHNYSIREDDFGTGDGASLAKNTTGNDEGERNFTTGSAGDHWHAITMNEIGNDEAHENRPPYYTLAYIIYTGL